MEQLDIRIRGLRELDRAFARADRDLQRKLRARLRGIAESVAVDARAIAEAKGLRESGDLIRGIRPFARAGGAGVRSSARHGGFNYPMRLEYEGRRGGKGSWGPRASLSPALAERHNQVFSACEQLLDDIADDYERGV